MLRRGSDGEDAAVATRTRAVGTAGLLFRSAVVDLSGVTRTMVTRYAAVSAGTLKTVNRP